MWPRQDPGVIARRLFGERYMARMRLPWVLAVAALGIFALGLALAGCVLVAGGGDVSARSTATSSLPVATPTTKERLAAVARAAFGGGVQLSEVSFDAQSQTLAVTGTLGGDVPVTASDVTAAHERTKTLCFRVQRALWASGIALREVTVFVRGPTFDDYGNQYVESYGTAVLGAATAGRFSWDALSADGAWGRYDRVWLRPNYEPNWYYGAPHPATPTSTSAAG